MISREQMEKVIKEYWGYDDLSRFSDKQIYMMYYQTLKYKKRPDHNKHQEKKRKYIDKVVKQMKEMDKTINSLVRLLEKLTDTPVVVDSPKVEPYKDVKFSNYKGWPTTIRIFPGTKTFYVSYISDILEDITTNFPGWKYKLGEF